MSDIPNGKKIPLSDESVKKIKEHAGKLLSCNHRDYVLVQYAFSLPIPLEGGLYHNHIVAFRCNDCAHMKLYDWNLLQSILAL